MSIRELGNGIVAFLFFFCLLAGLSSAEEGGKKIVIAVSPCSDVVLSFKKFHPLVTYLQAETGMEIKLVFPPDAAEFEAQIKNKDIDFAFQDPNVYVKFAPLYDQNTLLKALSLKGGVLQSGAVVTRKDSNIKTMKDLVGKSVMFGSKLSASKWVVAKMLFEENGIDIDKDLAMYANGGCCEDILFNVFLKAFDAGVVCDHFLDEHAKKQRELGVNAQELHVIATTRWVPTRVFSARKDVDGKIVSSFDRALLKLNSSNPEHAKILYSAEVGGFQQAKDEDYDEMRALIGEKKAR
ncbi:MAG: phosphate/phosphite/phosphonate ABC transporter substrate-binding protein [Desulfobulbaceae bacterium]|nr:phosphate/phosphite/phosphonate ABC transporter substrate-binding protein [Desulfobulbaceae bacterium]